MSSDEDEEYFDCDLEPIKYYAVACQKNKGSGIVTTDIAEAKKKVKTNKGSRFNSFYDFNEAQKFSESYLLDDSDSLLEKKNKVPKVDADPFSNVSDYDRNTFKAAVEAGDEEKCQTLINTNPRYLVTACDYPIILGAARFHYNALHVAAIAKQSRIVKLILHNLTQESFWRTLHPTADDRCNRDRMNRVIDMYLNTPDFWNRETSLHFASKFGCDECVRALLSQELMDTTLRNKDNFLAEDIICNRYTGPAIEEKKAQIRDIFSEKYVVLMDGDKVKVLEPVSHCQLLSLLRASAGENGAADGDSRGELSLVANERGTVRAYIGPLPAIKAQQLRCRWTVLNAEDAIKFEQTRRKDAEKGMECHGRFLAQLFDAPWKEYWPFLNCHVDLGDDDGLSKLEEHLGSVIVESRSMDGSAMLGDHSSVVDRSSEGDEGENEQDMDSSRKEGELSRHHWAYASLVRLFARLSLGNSTSSSDGHKSPRTSTGTTGVVGGEERPMVTSTPLQRPMVTSTPIRRPLAMTTRTQGPQTSMLPPLMDSLRSLRTPFNDSLLGQGLLTPTDRQVRRAMLDRSSGRHSNYPKVSSWLNHLSLVDPDEAEVSHTDSIIQHYNHRGQSINNMVTSTPLVTNRYHKPSRNKGTHNGLLSTCPMSPLAQIQLSD